MESAKRTVRRTDTLGKDRRERPPEEVMVDMLSFFFRGPKSIFEPLWVGLLLMRATEV